MKQVVIISCGPGLEDVRSIYGVAPIWIQNMCSISNIKFKVVRAYDGFFPDLDDGDCWIFTGSSSSVYEDKDWIVELEIRIKRAYEIAKPMLGICFGHQLIAQSLGGKVIKNPHGWEIGSYKIEFNNEAKDNLFFNDVDFDDYFYFSHQDVVSELPVNAIELAKNVKGNQIYSIGPKILGVQFHPEFSKQILNKYIETRLKLGATVDDKNVYDSLTSYNIINNFIELV